MVQRRSEISAAVRFGSTLTTRVCLSGAIPCTSTGVRRTIARRERYPSWRPRNPNVAQAQNARIILAGDTGQHKAVSRGDALRILEKNAGLEFATLEQIRGQTNEEYRQAVEVIAEGDAMGKGGKTRLQEGLEAFDRMGAISETAGEERYRRIAEDYADIVSQLKPNGQAKTSPLSLLPTPKYVM